MIDLAYEYKCDGCGATTWNSKFRIYLDYNEALPYPVLPEHWFKFGNAIFCEKHIVTMLVRDKETGAVSYQVLAT